MKQRTARNYLLMGHSFFFAVMKTEDTDEQLNMAAIGRRGVNVCSMC
jgi:hypothetical protein